MESLSKTNSGMALVVTDSKLLIGVVTDGDVRRGLLNSLSLDSSVDKIMTEVPKVLPVGSTHQEALATMKKYSLSQIPLVDSHGRVVDLHLLSDFVKSERYENIIFINAGGRGQRLHPLTENCPKPLLQVGNKPILENIIQNFINHGFYRFVVSVNYRANMVMEYFRDGSDWDVDIIYIQEETPLGTAGSLAELKGKTKLPIIISNGDLLTNVDYQNLLDYHVKAKTAATMCIKEYDIQVPYGVAHVQSNRLQKITEKPIHKFFINAGIYVINPEVLEFVDENKYLDMPDLFDRLLAEKGDVATFPIYEYWLDIGRFDDFEKAQIEFSQVTRGRV